MGAAPRTHTKGSDDQIAAERLALDQARLLHEVNEGTIGNANLLLNLLATKVKEDRAHKKWRAVMESELTEREMALNLEVVEEMQKRFALGAPLGAVPISTGALRSETALSGQVAQRAIQFLKATGRIVQCGRGRGKVVVLLHDTPLNLKGLSEPADTSEAADLARTQLSTSTLAQILVERINALTAERDQARAEVANSKDRPMVDAATARKLEVEIRRAQRRIEELESQNSKLREIIERQENELAEAKIATWQ